MKTSKKINIIFCCFIPIISVFMHYFFQNNGNIPNKIWVFLTIIEAAFFSIIFIYLMKKGRIQKIALLDIYFEFNLDIGIQLIKYLVAFTYVLLLYLTLYKAGYWTLFFVDNIDLVDVLIILSGFISIFFIIWYIITFKARRKLNSKK